MANGLQHVRERMRLQVAALIAVVIIILATLGIAAALAILKVDQTLITSIIGFVGPTVIALIALLGKQASEVTIADQGKRITELEKPNGQ